MINGNFLIGHETDFKNKTGVTIILAPNGAVGGVSVRGAAPGTRETDLLRPMNTVQEAHGIMLAGGSAFGLAAATGVMTYLHEQGIGFKAGEHLVPIVPAAVIFDLSCGQFAYPDEAMGYAAAKNATADNVLQGNIGAGCGATIGKLFGPEMKSKGGVGFASVTLADGTEICAVVVVNAVGDVYDTKGDFVSGVNHEEGLTTTDLLLAGAKFGDLAGQNTTIGCVMTNAKLTKEEVNKLADVAHDGLALAIKPVHTAFDGDTMFALASGEVETNLLALQAACVEVVRQAVVNGIKHRCLGE